MRMHRPCFGLSTEGLGVSSTATVLGEAVGSDASTLVAGNPLVGTKMAWGIFPRNTARSEEWSPSSLASSEKAWVNLGQRDLTGACAEGVFRSFSSGGHEVTGCTVGNDAVATAAAHEAP